MADILLTYTAVTTIKPISYLINRHIYCAYTHPHSHPHIYIYNHPQAAEHIPSRRRKRTQGSLAVPAAAVPPLAPGAGISPGRGGGVEGAQGRAVGAVVGDHARLWAWS